MSRPGSQGAVHTTKQDKSQEQSIINEIDEWLSGIDSTNFEEKISIFESNKSRWIEQIKYILKDLTRNHKNRVLEYILRNEQTHIVNSNRQQNKIYTLLNENVWVSKSNADFDDYDLVLETFDILISNGFNFIEFSVLSNESSNKSEIMSMLSNPYNFYYGVMHKDARFPSELQDNLFKFISIRMNLKNPNLFLSALQRNPNIQSTIISMIDAYYTEERVIERRLKSTESFLGALTNKDNRINPELRDRLYNYFTKIYWNQEHFITCLKLMFNKITDSNSMLFIDNMQFFLSRNVDIMSHEIFNLVVSRESTQISERNIINGLLSDLVGRKDLISYFESINIESIKHRFIDNILRNHIGWIEEVIQHQHMLNPAVPLEEFRTNDYGVLMMILGLAYSKGYMREEIFSVILQIIQENSINMVKPFGIFLETSQINPNDLEPMMLELIRRYIVNYYFNPQTGMREKYIIETILSNFVSSGFKSKIDLRLQNIEYFMSMGTFILPRPNLKQVLSKQSLTTNKFAGIYESDDEGESEEVGNEDVEGEAVESIDVESIDVENDDSEILEPNEEILKQINLYFKSNGTEESFDDLKYFIETSDTKIGFKEFTYALFYSFGERTLREIESIKRLIHGMSTIEGFEEIFSEFNNLVRTSAELIEMLKCDNPRIMEVISGLN